MKYSVNKAFPAPPDKRIKRCCQAVGHLSTLRKGRNQTATFSILLFITMPLSSCFCPPIKPQRCGPLVRMQRSPLPRAVPLAVRSGGSVRASARR
ncbi:unnamed protein product [Pleuronectes platessa]|uniref:Uncharacterized protein n=1 Tax=Pleuronectes platessa TaxID=8262 RepID=A0A9N7YZ34_PLEPL|nr:unnamed protein product [Pleuronectes platessa]